MRLPGLVFEAAINPLTLLSLTTGSHGISLWLAFIFMNQPTVLSLESDLAFEYTLAVFFFLETLAYRALFMRWCFPLYQHSPLTLPLINGRRDYSL